MDRLDLVDPELYRSGVPREYFRWLRDHEPVAWHDESDGPGYWFLSRYDDVVAANRDWHRYSNATKGSSIEEARSDEELAVRRRIFVNQDPPEHTRYRKLVSSVFTSRAVAALRDRVEETAKVLLDDLANRPGSVDIVERYCSQLPVTVIGDILGVPDQDRQQILEFGELGAPSLDVGLPWSQYRQVHQGIVGFNSWLADHLRQLRRNLGDD